MFSLFLLIAIIRSACMQNLLLSYLLKKTKAQNSDVFVRIELKSVIAKSSPRLFPQGEHYVLVMIIHCQVVETIYFQNCFCARTFQQNAMGLSTNNICHTLRMLSFSNTPPVTPCS